MTRILTTALALAISLCLLQDLQAGERYALLVGVKNYRQDSGLSNLKYPENDMEALAELLHKSGYPKDNIVAMTQVRGVEEARFFPLAKSIRKELKLLLGACQSDDSVLIGFAGHGVQFKDSNDAYFCPMDTILKDRTSLVSLTEIYKELQASKATTKLLLVDACRNDPFQQSFQRSIDLKSKTEPQKLALPGGTAAFFSCSSGEEAYEHPELKHGVFFHYVIQGLKGEADFTKDQQIELAELELYVTKQVSNSVRVKFAALQRPHLLKNSVGEMVILSHAAKQADPPIIKSNSAPPVEVLPDSTPSSPVSGSPAVVGNPPSDSSRSEKVASSESSPLPNFKNSTTIGPLNPTPNAKTFEIKEDRFPKYDRDDVVSVQNGGLKLKSGSQMLQVNFGSRWIVTGINQVDESLRVKSATNQNVTGWLMMNDVALVSKRPTTPKATLPFEYQNNQFIPVEKFQSPKSKDEEAATDFQKVVATGYLNKGDYVSAMKELPNGFVIDVIVKIDTNLMNGTTALVRIPKNQKLTIGKVQEGWLSVSYQNKSGWIRASDVQSPTLRQELFSSPFSGWAIEKK